MDKPVVEIDELAKNFGKVQAVDRVSLKIKPGEIFALIGPNGAGKTTLIKMLVGLLAPTGGRAMICGEDVVLKPLAAKKHFGYVPDNPLVYDYLTGREFLRMTGTLRGMPEKEIKTRIEELAELFPIKDLLGQRMSTYSRGNRQKTAFLASLMTNPDLLVIDEPIAGLDPTSIAIFGDSLKRFAKSGGAVFLATHILSFGQEYADRVGAMNKGKLLKETAVAEHKLEDIYKEAADSK